MKFPVTSHPGISSDLPFMQLAIEQAGLASNKGEVPIGAVIELNGKIIGAAHNAPVSSQDACAHAEVLAIRQACQAIGNYRLGSSATLYVTLQPCLMCLGAILHARIGRVVIGCEQSRFNTKLENVLAVVDQSEAWHACHFETGCLQAECESLLGDFFRLRRKAREDTVAQLDQLMHLPNVNKETIAELGGLGFSTPADFIERGLAHTAEALEKHGVALELAGRLQQAAIFASLADYFNGEPVHSWKHYLKSREDVE